MSRQRQLLVKTEGLKGFTIVEILIVMALSGIVIIMGMLYFQKISSYIRKSTKNTEKELELLMLENILKQDMFQAADAKFNQADNVLELQMFKDVITYEFHNNYVLRIREQTDTLYANLLSVEPGYLDKDLQILSNLSISFSEMDQVRYIELIRPRTALLSFENILSKEGNYGD